MTLYDDIIDLALISIEDYKLNKLAIYIDEINYDLLVSSASYSAYKDACEDQDLLIVPVIEVKYNYIKNAEFDSYDKYVEDALKNLKMVLEGFMIRGLPNFNNCKKDLSQRDDEARVFNINLDDLEKSILADYTVIMWLDKEINDVRQITGMLRNKTEANRYSEANLLREKSTHRIKMREDVNKKQTDYSFKNVPWRDWADGKYGL